MSAKNIPWIGIAAIILALLTLVSPHSLSAWLGSGRFAYYIIIAAPLCAVLLAIFSFFLKQRKTALVGLLLGLASSFLPGYYECMIGYAEHTICLESDPEGCSTISAEPAYCKETANQSRLEIIWHYYAGGQKETT